MCRQAVSPPSVEPYLSRGRLVDPRYHVETGSFACPVRAEQPKDLLPADLKADIVHRFESPEIYGQVLYREDLIGQLLSPPLVAAAFLFLRFFTERRSEPPRSPPGRNLIIIHSQTSRTSRLTDGKTCLLQDFVQTFFTNLCIYHP